MTPEAAEAAFREEIEALQTTVATAYEIEKVKNKFEANTLFGELNVMNKAMNLGFYEMLGDLALINREVGLYRAVGDDDIRSVAALFGGGGHLNASGATIDDADMDSVVRQTLKAIQEITFGKAQAE